MSEHVIADPDSRNQWGLPTIEVYAHPLAAQSTQIDQSVNKALPWVAFSWLLSGGAIIGLFLMALLMPEIIDSRVAAGIAEAKEATHEDTAEANAVAKLARSDAGVALDKLEDLRTQLATKGINIELDGH